MKKRTITPGKTLVQRYTYTQQALPTDKPIVQYIRQSTTKQLKRNKQSYELQDSDLRRDLLAMGWLEQNIIKIDSDQGKSGTKRRDERTGLDQLYELVESGQVGAVAAFDVSRLYRVLSRAEYGAFCDMVLEKQIPVITASRVYWPTRTDNDQLSDDFRAAAAFIEDIIKGKLIAAKNRHIQYDTSYGGHSIPLGYTVTGMGDEQADRKYYTIYEPHAELVRWLFKRFRELGGNLPLLARELALIDFRFPAFEQGIVARVSLPMDEDGSYPLRNRQAIIGILTNRAYIGQYVYSGVLVSEQAHTPIVGLDDFMWAYERLSGVSLDGTEQARKPRERRYGGASALLDGVLRSGDMAVYAIEGKYTARKEVSGFPTSELVVQVDALDTAFSRVLISALASVHSDKESGRQNALTEQVQALKQEQVKQVTDYAKDIARIDDEISKAEMAQRVSKELGDEQGYRDNTKQLVQLRRDRLAIEQKADQADKEVQDLDEVHSLFQQAGKDWQGMSTSARKRLVRLTRTRANIRELSPHFIWLDVALALPERHHFILYLYRANGSRQFWTTEEDSTLQQLFPTASKEDVMEALPTHSWVSICYRGYEKLGIRRTANKQDVLAYADMQVMEKYGARVDEPVWVTELRDTGEYMPELLWLVDPSR